MINDKKISGLVVLSEAELGCYPYVEAISSFLPVVDEMVVSFNIYGKKDGSKDKVLALSEKIRIIPTVFDIEKYGWISYGVARTMGYQACKGEIVLMFDADGVLHENDHRQLNKEIFEFISNPHMPTGYWEKHRFYKPNLYYSQHKHSGIYNKEILGDRFDFMRVDGKGAPNFDRLKLGEDRSKKFSITLFGYEHLWDTEEVLRYKVNRYGRMIDKISGNPFKSPEEYFDKYMVDLFDNRGKWKSMPIELHPKVIQDKLRSINESHFGNSFFGYK